MFSSKNLHLIYKTRERKCTLKPHAMANICKAELSVQVFVNIDTNKYLNLTSHTYTQTLR